ncbi:GspE/PulE family protein [Candidatus Margulisiibacteriota bacterium]
MEKTSLFKVLIDKQLVCPDELSAFEGFSDFDLYKIAREKFHVPEEKLHSVISDAYKIPFNNLSALVIDPKLSEQLETRGLVQDRLIPIYKENNTIYFATDNPFLPCLDDIRNTEKQKVELILVPSTDINNHLGIKKDQPPSETTVLDQVLRQAIESRASDIHINKDKEEINVIFRINGKLFQIREYAGEQVKKLTALIKLHSHMDISLINKPQDGRLTYKYKNDGFDIRVSSLPTVFGEDFVLRLFNIKDLDLEIGSLGFSLRAEEIIQELLTQKSGLVLVTGATGSGKSTSLYAFLSYLLAKTGKNIITLEDPIETIIKGIRQSQVNPRIGYDFVGGLRAILRQDPDIIMIGEIRDSETAKIALQAAYTGHLVLSTLHTCDCRSTLLRLKNFQLDPFLATQTLKGIISQKLVLKLCPECRIEAVKTDVPGGFKRDFLPKGCEKCSYTGYEGRTVLSEALHVKDRGKVWENKFAADMDLLIKNNTYYTFEEDIKNKVNTGRVSYKDILKEYVF